MFGNKLKIFIYGGTGYLGRSLISSLGEKYKFFATSRNAKKSITESKLYIEKRDTKKIIKKLKESDLILIANGPSFKDSAKNLFSYIKYLNDQANLISKVKKKKAKIIYFSSIHVYENYKTQKSKISDLLNSRSNYAIRNIVCENLLLNKLKNQNINIIRISNIFGIHKKLFELSDSFFRLSVNQFCLNVVKNKKTIIYSNLNEKRNFVSVNDFVNFIEKAFILKNYKFNTIINYASKNEISMKYLINTIKNQSKKIKIKSPKIKFLNKIKSSKINYKFDLKDIEKYKLEPKISLKNEIENTLKKIQKLT